MLLILVKTLWKNINTIMNEYWQLKLLGGVLFYLVLHMPVITTEVN